MSGILQSFISPARRILLGAVCLVIVLVLLAAAGTIPFFFESSSILYKFGQQKQLLRTGKIVGITTALLIFLQIIMVSRFTILDRIFALNRVFDFHRINGVVIFFLALLHPFLIIAADDFTIFRFEMRYWPEIVGLGLLCVTITLSPTAYWRNGLKIPYHVWLFFHRNMATLIIILMFVHVRFVSDSFGTGLPLQALTVMAVLSIPLIGRIWKRRVRPAGKKYRVSLVTKAGRNAWALEMEPDRENPLSHAPGQFAFITPLSAEVAKEEHPFTIASAPNQSGTLQFIIRAAGDWTSTVSRLKQGETVMVDGPYGLFSHLAVAGDAPLVMIAGGIGITPMLSMLRHLAWRRDEREILLVWSNRSPEHIVFPGEFEKLSDHLPGLRIAHVFTRLRDGPFSSRVRHHGVNCESRFQHRTGKGSPGAGDARHRPESSTPLCRQSDDKADSVPGEPLPGRRLDRTTVSKLVKTVSRRAKIFLCGPPAMMDDLSRILKKEGFPGSAIYKEEFRL